jgi:hypothetical protein
MPLNNILYNVLAYNPKMTEFVNGKVLATSDYSVSKVVKGLSYHGICEREREREMALRVTSPHVIHLTSV